MHRGRHLPPALLAWAGLLLGACVSAPPPAMRGPAVAAPAVKPAEPTADTALTDFETRQRQSAEAAMRQGHWAEATWAWDVVLALKPDDATARAQRNQAQASAQAAVVERLRRARLAQQRGDTDTAQLLYLEVLALIPGQPDAAEALRAIERERVTRHHLGQLSRHTLTRRGIADGMVRPGATARATPAAVSEVQRNEVEHASLLAGQGEVGAAIELLKPLAEARRSDPGARLLLADLYQRQADGLAAANPSGAIEALERSLQLNPANSQARTRLAQLRAAPRSAPAARTSGTRP